MVAFFPPFRFSRKFPSQKSTVASLVLYSKAKRCGPAVSTTRGQATPATAGNTGNTRARPGLVSRHSSALQCGVAGLKTRAPCYANATLITPSAMSAKGPHGMLRPRASIDRGASASHEPWAATGEPLLLLLLHCSALAAVWWKKDAILQRKLAPNHATLYVVVTLCSRYKYTLIQTIRKIPLIRKYFRNSPLYRSLSTRHKNVTTYYVTMLQRRNSISYPKPFKDM